MELEDFVEAVLDLVDLSSNEDEKMKFLLKIVELELYHVS